MHHIDLPGVCERERVCVCVCVFVCERERERERERKIEREPLRDEVRMHHVDLSYVCVCV